ncbi:hypothetical protein LXL04_020364 [Taraxacum kok-saghyz]
MEERMEGKKVINMIKAKLGNGEKLQLWNEAWNGEDILKHKYPRLFNLETEKNATVPSRLSINGGNWKWRRTVREGREKEELESLQSEIGKRSLNNEIDRWWIPSSPGDVGEGRPRRNRFKYMWDRSIPIKTNILNWRVARGRIPVRIVLAKMGINTQNQNCPFCEIEPETIEHVFLGCNITQELWRFVGAWWNIGIPYFKDVMEVFKWTEKLSKSSII